MADEEKVTRIFEMSAEVAELFFIIVKELTDRGIEDSEELRIQILSYLAKQGGMERVYETKRTKEQFIVDMQNKGFKIHDATGGESDG